MTRTRPLLALLLLFGCAGNDAEAAEPVVEETAGAEVEPEPEVPTGPTLSYVDPSYSVVMRLDMERVRASSLSREISAQVRGYETWRNLLGASGIDPVRDFDRVLATAPGSVVGESILLVRHHLTNAQVRESVLNMSVERSERPAWRQMDGFDVVDWPADTDPPRVVVLTAENELVVCTPSMVERVIEVAHDHRLRREADETVEPELQLAERVIATVNVSELTETTRSRIQHPPDAFEVELTDDAEEQGRLHIRANGQYADAAQAEAARAYFADQRDFYAGQMLVRAVGLDRPLREAEITAEGPTLNARASFTEEEVERVLGLLAAMQQFTQP